MNRFQARPWTPAVLRNGSTAAAAVTLLSLGTQEVLASGEPYESPLYQNCVAAIEVFEKALAAHGSPDLIDRKVSFRAEIEGHYLAEGHYERPWAIHDHAVEITQTYSAPLQAIRQDSYYNYNRPMEGVIILDATSGIECRVGRKESGLVSDDELAEYWTDQFKTFPHEWLRQAQSNRETLRSLGQTDTHDIIGFADESGAHFALYFDQESHLLHRIENVGHWKLKGDRLEWREFTNYEEMDGHLIARDYRDHHERSGSQYGMIQYITSVEFDVDVASEEFIVPEKFAAGVEGWEITPSDPASGEEFLPITDLGRGLYIVDLPACDSRSLLVEFDDFSVVVEAGNHSAVSRQLLETAENLLPGKPVRYVGMTHHHPLYSGGLRPYAQRGVTILTTAGNVDYYRDLTTRPYRISPDVQEISPREPIIQVIDEELIIEDGSQRVEFHAFDPGTHVEEFVLPYVPSHKLVITGDFVKFGLEKSEPRPAHARVQALYDIIQERDLEVESFVQTWFLRDGRQIGTMEEVEASVQLAAAQKAEEEGSDRN